MTAKILATTYFLVFLIFLIVFCVKDPTGDRLHRTRYLERFYQGLLVGMAWPSLPIIILLIALDSWLDKTKGPQLSGHPDLKHFGLRLGRTYELTMLYMDQDYNIRSIAYREKVQGLYDTNWNKVKAGDGKLKFILMVDENTAGWFRVVDVESFPCTPFMEGKVNQVVQWTYRKV